MEKVIFRKEKEGNIIAFLPETPATYGRIECLTRIDGHCEADLMYYRYETKPASQEEYQSLLAWMKNAYGYNPRVMKRVQYRDLLKAWRYE